MNTNNLTPSRTSLVPSLTPTSILNSNPHPCPHFHSPDSNPVLKPPPPPLIPDPHPYPGSGPLLSPFPGSHSLLRDWGDRNGMQLCVAYIIIFKYINYVDN